MRVLHVIPSMGNGGAERILANLYQKLDEKESYEQLILSLSNDTFVLKDLTGFKVEVVNLKKISFLSIWRIYKIVKEFNPDLISGWLYLGAFFAVLIGSLKKTVIVCLHHSLDDLSCESKKTRVLVYMLKYFTRLNFVRKIIFVSNKSFSDHKRYGYSAEKSMVIHNGISDLFLNQPSHRKTNKEVLSLGNFGRYHPVKDHRLFLETCYNLRVKFPNIKVLFAGVGMTSDNTDLIEIIRFYGLEDCVELVGEQANLVPYYQSIDIYLLTSKNESFPNVILESIACGTPVVSTNVGDARSMIGKYGFVSEDRNPVRLSELVLKSKLELLSGRYPSHEMSDFVTNCFSSDVMCNSYEEVFKNSCDLG